MSMENHTLNIGDKAPSFMLQDTISSNYMSYEDLRSDSGTVVMFICNHCPYVIHVFREIVDMANEYKSRGIQFIAISSNDIETYPDDAPDKMKIVAKVLKFPFPYLYDKRQEVARQFDAQCTPEFYLFTGNNKLYYHGRLDDSKPGSEIPVTGKDLRSALNLLIQKEEAPQAQYPSIGCSIKWKNN